MKKEIVVFGGGCFWCTEAVFRMMKGVISVVPGYAGGKPISHGEKPNYEIIHSGDTGYAEVVRIEYDREKLSFKELLTVFFGSHDPATPNRQGPDVGSEYRSAIFYTTPEQKNQAEAFIREINASSGEGKPIVTEVLLLTQFYKAEEEHRNYYEKNKSNRYCELVINPKLEKVQRQFASLLKIVENK